MLRDRAAYRLVASRHSPRDTEKGAGRHMAPIGTGVSREMQMAAEGGRMDAKRSGKF